MRMDSFRKALTDSGELSANRRSQSTLWFQRELSLSIIERMAENPALSSALATLEGQVAEGGISPTQAARQIVERMLADKSLTSE
jgi:putative protein kinase ArgK-like GTPase of G3E family